MILRRRVWLDDPSPVTPGYGRGSFSAGKGPHDCTDREQDSFRAHAMDCAIRVSFDPLSEPFGSARLAAATRAVLDL
jgi:hypothetical protein